jgi:hypothetical protein
MHNPELVKFYFELPLHILLKLCFAKPFFKRRFVKIENAEKHKTER